MKRLIGLAVAVAIGSLIWGCQKQTEPAKAPEVKPPAPVVQPTVPPPPPPAGEQQGGGQ